MHLDLFCNCRMDVWRSGVQLSRFHFSAGQNNNHFIHNMDYCRLKQCCRYFDRPRCRSIEREKGRVMVMIYRSGGVQYFFFWNERGVQLGPSLSLNSLALWSNLCSRSSWDPSGRPAGQQLLLAIIFHCSLIRICFDATLRPDTTICDRWAATQSSAGSHVFFS